MTNPALPGGYSLIQVVTGIQIAWIIVHSLVHHLFIHSFLHLLIHSFLHLLIRFFVHLFIRSFVHSFIHSYIHSFLR